MRRYIDADKLLKNWCESICKPKPNCSDDCFVYDEITNAPSADVTEVIRCKDCAKREYCRTSTVWAVAPPDDWYCADAERRTDG